jgi:hypothetical protein
MPKKRNQSDLGLFVSQISSSVTANYMQQFFMLSGNPQISKVHVSSILHHSAREIPYPQVK